MNLLYANDGRGMYPASYYAASAEPLAVFPALTGAQRFDVCVVGGGYTGLSTALHLAQAGYRVALVEAQRVGWGASGRNGGQVGSGQRIEQDELERVVGQDTAHQLWDIAQEAKALVASLVEDHQIACDYSKGVAHVDWAARDVPHTHGYVDKLRAEYGYDQVTKLDQGEATDLLGTDVYAGGLLDMGAAHLHPLKYALGLARACVAAGVSIFENSEVVRVVDGDPARVMTEHGQITADFVILGANGYLGGLAPQVAAKVMPINNFIIATEPIEGPMTQNIAVADSKFVVNYYRKSADGRLLFGGGESYGYRFPRDIEGLVRRAMAEVYPDLRDVRVDYAWGGTLAITMNRMPQFQRLSSNILSASGYSGHGVAMATMAGKILSQAVQGQAEQFDVMATVPAMKFPGGPSLRSPLLVLAMTWYAMRDRLGI